MVKITQYPRNADGTPMDLKVGLFTDTTGNGGARLIDQPIGPDGAPIDSVALVFINQDGSTLTLSGNAPSLKIFGAIGDGSTDDTAAVAAAVAHGALTGQPVFVPKGVYLVNPAAFPLYAVAADRFVMFGEGASSIIKVKDGTITADNKWLFDLAPTSAMELIEFRDMFVDMNARGSAAPVGDFDYQHSQTFFVRPSAPVKMVRFDNVVVKDPVADVFNASQDTTEDLIGTYIVNNCAVIDRTRTRSDICLTRLPMNTIISGFRGAVIEVELNVATTTKKRVQISNSNVDRLDLAGRALGTDVDGVPEQVKGLVEITLSNVIAPVSCWLQNVKVRVNNCVLGVYDNGSGSHRYNNLAPGSRFSGCEFRHHYDAALGASAVTQLRIFRNYTMSRKSSIVFSDCLHVIDTASPFDAVTPGTNSLVEIESGCPVGEIADNIVEFNKSRFDPRAYRSIKADRCGTVVAKDCKYGGVDAAAFYGMGATANGFGTDFTMDGGDFSEVTGALLTGSWNDVNQDPLGAKGYLRLRGDWRGVTTQALVKNAASTPTVSRSQLQIKSNRRIVAAAAPVTGLLGDIIELDASVIAAGAVDSYRCTVSSATAATWKARSTLAA